MFKFFLELFLIEQLAAHDAIDLRAQFGDAIFVGKLHFGLPTDKPCQDVVTECKVGTGCDGPDGHDDKATDHDPESNWPYPDLMSGVGERVTVDIENHSALSIGCQSCVQACAECDTHRGVSMIHLETIQRRESVQTAPQVCMHCEDPICARVCPADAIKKTPDGVVQSSLKPRCIGCSNCVLSCPFGVPKYQVEIDQMMKCDMCYDRTSVDKKPMCATVCPSGALTYATAEEIQRSRRGIAINSWKFGNEEVKTKVFVIVPREVERVNVELVQISPTPTALSADPYDVALMLEGLE